MAKNRKVTAKKNRRKVPSPRISNSASTRKMRTMFPQLKEADGCAALLEIAERTGGKWEHRSCNASVKSSMASTSKNRRTRIRMSPSLIDRLAAVGHVSRFKIMALLLDGPGTYKALQKETKLKAGPLYHHINQLRLTKLILPKQRDIYELTRGGRNLLLSIMAVGHAMGDGRRRPVS